MYNLVITSAKRSGAYSKTCQHKYVESALSRCERMRRWRRSLYTYIFRKDNILESHFFTKVYEKLYLS